MKHIVILIISGISCSLFSQAQIPDNIVQTNFEVHGNADPLVASQSIVIKPNSRIHEGSTFRAYIDKNAYIPVDLSKSENYIFTRLYQNSLLGSSVIRNNADVIESVTYFDGLGRPKQQVGIKASPDAKDIVAHISYDDYGRQDRKYLPFKRQTGALGSFNVVNISNNINSYYKTKYPEDFEGITLGDVNACSESNFEDSPLNRVVEQGAPGKDWKVNKQSNTDHTIKFDWTTNDADEVVYFKVNFHQNNSEVPILVKEGYYSPNELYVTLIKDENWQPGQTHENDRTIREYKDKLGRVILKRTFNEGVAHDTYYVYDDFGNLTYVIPPKVTTEDGVSQNELDELCYQYIYDYRNRLVEKKIPGKGREYIIYNKLDQPILTQDAVQRPKREWLFTKYDAFGRVAFTGIEVFPWDTTRAGLQQNLDNDTNAPQYEYRTATSILVNGTRIYYSNNTFPGGGEILTVNYYDDYEVGDIVAFNPAQGSGTWEGMTASAQVKGLPTVSQVRVLETSVWITTATYYDEKGRAWETHIKNDYLGTEDWILNKLDFVGKVLKTRGMHTKSGATITTIDTFTYDHMGRLLTQTQKINDQAEETIGSNTYDALGQLETKEVGGGLQTVDYGYNVRGWLTGINDVDTDGDKLFSFKINYNTVEGRYSDTPKLYNGNIAQTIWKTANDYKKRSYAYEYDHLNRITRANNARESDLSVEDAYSVWGIAYDKNGNIQRLSRNGSPIGTTYQKIDELYYTYSHNKLLNVRDASTFSQRDEGFKDGTNSDDDYTYDLNGNMIGDKNKNISNINYNYLNLPTYININGNTEQGSITYTYSADGTKLSKLVINGVGGPQSQGDLTQYAGNYIYTKKVYPGGCPGCPIPQSKLKFMNHPEGYTEPIDPNDYSKGFEYIYQYKDHLGNIRLSYKDSDSNGVIATNEIVEEKNYYPFGLQHKGYNNTVLSEHPYGYQSQETEEELGKNTIAFQWRDYDPAIARFNKIDRFAEKYNPISPYAFTKNNPILYREIAGDSIVDADNIVRDYRNTINNQITALDQLLNNNNFNFNALGTTRAAVTQLRGDLNGVIGELDALENSDQIYRVSFDASLATNEGGVSFDNSDNSVAIQVGAGSSIGVISQELLHGYQFESGEISISYDNSAYGTLYDIGDETATYRREHTVVRGVAGLQTRNSVTNASTRAQGASMTPPAYVGLPSRSINLNSPEGVSLRATNQLRRSLNASNSGTGLAPTSPTEVFIGWNRN